MTHHETTKTALATLIALTLVLGSASAAEAACLKIPFIGQVCAPKSGCIKVAGVKLCAPWKPAPKPGPKPQPKPEPIHDSEPDLAASKRYKVGKCKYAGAELVYDASVDIDDEYAASALNGKLNGCFANISKTIAHAKLSNENKKTRASLKLAGKTVYSKKLSASGKVVKGPYISKVRIRGKLPIVPGLVSGYGRADIGAGARFDLRWYRSAFPPRADLTANARAFGHGSGEIGLSALDVGVAKLASASLNADLEFLNPEGRIDAAVSLKGLEAQADVVVEGYRLYLKGRVKAGCAFGYCVYDKSKTLINRRGAKRTYSLLDIN